MGNNLSDILLVEDNPNDAELITRALKRINLSKNLTWLKDGEEALCFLFPESSSAGNNPAPKLILLDLKLPKVDGYEVLEKIKAEESMKNIPVVIFSSSREDSDLAECYRKGANSYIVKPVDFAKFIGAVEEIGLYWLHLNQAMR